MICISDELQFYLGTDSKACMPATLDSRVKALNSASLKEVLLKQI